MTDDPLQRLEQAGKAEVPAIDDAFADRLESHLRVEHSQRGEARRRRVPVWLPRATAAVLIALAGIAAVLLLNDGDGGVPLEVVEGETTAPVPASEGGADDGDDPIGVGGDDGRVIVPVATPSPTSTSTPTATAAVPSPTSRAGSSDGAATPNAAEPTVTAPTATGVPPAATPASPDQPTVTGDTTATPSPASTATPLPQATATPLPRVTPTPLPVPTPLAVPTPTSTPTPRPTPIPTPTATPTPSATAEPVLIEMTCVARVAGDALGVRCSWRPPPGVDLTSYQLLRSRNGGPRSTISNQRATAEPRFVDRDVAPGDQLIYVVRALAGDRIVGASDRQVVEVAVE